MQLRRDFEKGKPRVTLRLDISGAMMIVIL
jgi:hypothetical protein